MKTEVKFQYRHKRPKKLRNDVFVIYSPKKFTLNPGEIKNVNMGIKIFLPRHMEGKCTLIFSYSNQKLKLLNSSLISQQYNSNIEIEKIFEEEEEDNLPPWNLNFELLNGNFTNSLTIKKDQELGYFYLLTQKREEIKYKFEKKCFFFLNTKNISKILYITTFFFPSKIEQFSDCKVDQN